MLRRLSSPHPPCWPGAREADRPRVPSPLSHPGASTLNCGRRASIGSVVQSTADSAAPRNSDLDYEWVMPPLEPLADIMNELAYANKSLKHRRRRSQSLTTAMFSISRRKRQPPPLPEQPAPEPDLTLPSVPTTDMPELDRFLVESGEYGAGPGSNRPGKAKVSGEAVPIRGAYHKPSSFHAGSPPQSSHLVYGARAASDSGHGPLYAPREPNRSIAALYSRANFPPVPSDGFGGLVTGSPPASSIGFSMDGPRDGAVTPSTIPRSTAFPVVRRTQRQPPHLNLLVAGAHATGKTSFLRTLLATTTIAPGQNRAAMQSQVVAFGVAKGKGGKLLRTKKLEELTVEVVTELGDRVSLTAVDTPGFDAKSDDFRVDLQVSSILRYIESRFDDSLKLESQVHRNPGRAGESHVHLVLYFVDPSTVYVREGGPGPYGSPTRRASGGRSKSTPALLGTKGGNHADAEEQRHDLEDGLASMSPVDLRQIKRLSQRANVVPVVARADELTNSRLAEVKGAILRDLRTEGLDFGVFQSEGFGIPEGHEGEEADAQAATEDDLGVWRGREHRDDDDDDEYGEAEGDKSERTGRKRSATAATATTEEGSDAPAPTNGASATLSPTNGHGRAPLHRRRSHSTNRRGSRNRAARPSLFLDAEVPVPNGDGEPETPAFDHLLPFALISPESTALVPPVPSKSPRRPTVSNPSRPDGAQNAPAPAANGEVAQQAGSSGFVRTFRWGTIDVMNPDHCDLSPLKAALLGTHMKLLKDSTRHTKYEKYRTERLLARRATQQISSADQRKLAREVESLAIPSATSVRLRLESRAPPVSRVA